MNPSTDTSAALGRMQTLSANKTQEAEDVALALAIIQGTADTQSAALEAQYTGQIADLTSQVAANATLITALQASVAQLIAAITPLDTANTYVNNGDGTITITPVATQ